MIKSRRYFFNMISTLGLSYYLGNIPVINASEQNLPYSLDNILAPRYLGSLSAPIKMIEYASFTCSHCADFHEQKFSQINEKYIKTGLLVFEFRDFPLDGLALRASCIARLLEKEEYFNFINILFKTQKRWTNSNNPIDELKKLGTLAGLNSEQIHTSINDMSLLENIFNLRKIAEAEWSIKSTPTFIINNEIKIQGNQPLEKFEDAFDKFSS